MTDDLPIDASEPDENDLFYASHKVLKSCPFCGSHSVLPMVWKNDQTGIYRAVVECTCSASTSYNSYDKEEARAHAITKWEKRAK